MSTLHQDKAKPCWSEAFYSKSETVIIYNFEFYHGKNTGISAEYRELGLRGSVLMRLVDNMPQNENFKVYFDSFFGSIQLLVFKVYSATVPSQREKRQQSFALFLIFVIMGLIIGLKQLKSNLPSDANWNFTRNWTSSVYQM